MLGRPAVNAQRFGYWSFPLRAGSHLACRLVQTHRYECRWLTGEEAVRAPAQRRAPVPRWSSRRAARTTHVLRLTSEVASLLIPRLPGFTFGGLEHHRNRRAGGNCIF